MYSVNCYIDNHYFFCYLLLQVKLWEVTLKEGLVCSHSSTIMCRTVVVQLQTTTGDGVLLQLTTIKMGYGESVNTVSMLIAIVIALVESLTSGECMTEFIYKTNTVISFIVINSPGVFCDFFSP